MCLFFTGESLPAKKNLPALPAAGHIAYPIRTQCVQVNLELGHRATYRKKPTPEGFTHDWSVFVRGPEGNNAAHFIDKVVFHLHESFPKPKRGYSFFLSVKEPPYEVSESGYAGFLLPIEVYFKNKEEPRKVQFQYDLFLYTDMPVNNIRPERLTFNNPSEEFRRRLIKGGGVAVFPEDSSKMVSPALTGPPAQPLHRQHPAKDKGKIPKSSSTSSSKDGKTVSKEAKGPKEGKTASKEPKFSTKEAKTVPKEEKPSGKDVKPAPRASVLQEAPLFPDTPSVKEGKGSQLKKEGKVSSKRPSESTAGDTIKKKTKKSSSAGEAGQKRDKAKPSKAKAEGDSKPKVKVEPSRSQPMAVNQPEAASQQPLLQSDGESAGSNASVKDVKINTSPSKQKTKSKPKGDRRHKMSNGQPNNEYLNELLELHQRIVTLKDRQHLQRIVNLIEETGHFNVTKTTFDFDLCRLDKVTVRKLQSCLDGL
ncbi:Myeloid lymphoid or mixed-lineage leukemia (trithorax, ) [Branchiostoma belcheri]|nr:Myeloid lymphoid or mixed-lineage leukemia (trithorax, ) [Branchiostoma belcheri]